MYRLNRLYGLAVDLALIGTFLYVAVFSDAIGR